MEKKLQGIALILFGIMLLLISMHSPWIPIIGTDYTDLALWIGIILGIVRSPYTHPGTRGRNAPPPSLPRPFA